MIRVIQSIIIIIEADIRTDLITIHKQTLHINIHEGLETKDKHLHLEVIYT